MPTNDTLTCQHCGTPIVRKAHGRKARKWCSTRCANIDWHEKAAELFTGFCATCGDAIASPRRYCSRACMTKALTTGNTLAEYTCEWCGKVVTRRPWLAQKQRYCSPSCGQLASVGRVAIPTLSTEFGSWLAGLVDGEGCFTIPTNPTTRARFSMGFRDDDLPTLDSLQRELGFGRIYRSATPGGKVGGRPQATLICVRLTDCEALAAIFRKFPLRSKKARDFAIWADFVDILAGGETDPKVLQDYAHRIKAIKKYVSPES